LKPKNKKQFNWSFVRFYLMWLLTTMLALIPLVVLFTKTPNEEIKRRSGVDTAQGVEKVNYEEVANGLDSLITIVKDIDMNNDSRSLRRTLAILDNYAGEIYGLSADYEELTEESEDDTEKLLKKKDKEISELENEILEKKIALQNCRNALGN